MIVSIEDCADLQLEGGGWRCRPILLGKLNDCSDTVGMKHLCFEDHLGWLVGKFFREAKGRLVESSLEWGVLWTLKAHSPFEEVFLFQTN